MQRTIPLLDTSTSKTHDHTANNHSRHVGSRTSDCSTDDKDEAEEDENPAHVEDEEDLAGEAEAGEEGEGVGEADPWEQLDVAEGFVDARLDVGDVTDIVAW
jgi:hypothetical protein